jgi:hypothetical protein
MANWTPSGFIGQMFKLVASRVPPPAGMASPVLWGSEEVVRERLGEGTSSLETSREFVHFEFPFSPAQSVEHFFVYYGPSFKAFNALDENGQKALRQELEKHWTANNQATNGSTDVPSEYLKVVAVRS